MAINSHTTNWLIPRVCSVALAWLTQRWLGLAIWEYFFLMVGLVTIPLSLNRTQILHDEPDWIHQSQSLELFISFDFSNPYWNVQHYTLTEPPLSRYIIGIGRRLGGYTPEDLNSLERFYKGDPTYTVDPGLIRWSRIPMVILATLTTLILYWMVRRCAGRLAAFIFLSLFLLNPSMVGWLIVAQSDMPVLFFVVLALPPALFAFESWRSLPVDSEITIGQMNRVLFWLIIVGTVGGLAAAAKLNGFAASLVGSTLGVLMALFDRRLMPVRLRLQFLIRAVILPVLAGLVIMISLNPFLYPAPFAYIGKMLAYRVYEMEWQANTWPQYRVPGGWERIPFMLARIFQDYAAIRIPLSIYVNLSLFLIGIGQLGLAGWKNLRRRVDGNQNRSAAGLVLLVVGGCVSLPMLFTPLDWNRYYLFPVVFSSVGIAIGISMVLSAFWQWSRDRLTV